MDGSGWVPNAARKPWLSVVDAMAWIAWRGGAETADTEVAAAELRQAERVLVERAGDGLVRAQGVPGLEQHPEGSIPVPIGPESFRAADVGLHLTGQMDLRSDAPLDRMVGPRAYFGSPSNNYATRGPTYHRVELSTADVLREWPPRSLQASTIAAERRLEEWLAEKMRANPDSPPGKGVIKTEAEAAGHSVSGHGFTRAYANAVKAAEAPAWSAPGRKSKRRIETPR